MSTSAFGPKLLSRSAPSPATPTANAAHQGDWQPLWHPRDAAAYLGINQKTVIRMARQRQIPSLRLGKHWRFRVSDMVAWAAGKVESVSQPVE